MLDFRFMVWCYVHAAIISGKRIKRMFYERKSWNIWLWT